MRLKKFKNVKWDKKKQFKELIAKFNLSKDVYELIDIVSNKNIVVVIFNSLLREKNVDFKKHVSETNLMKLYSALAITDFVDFKNKESMKNDIDKAIKKLTNKKDFKDKAIKETNWEKEMIKGYSFSDKEISDYFSANDYYQKMAEVFSAPFKEQNYYDFAYLLIMYVSIETFFNKYNVPENVDIFLVKLEVQQKMIEILSFISPENYNTMIINMNKWFKSFDKKLYKLLVRKRKK